MRPTHGRRGFTLLELIVVVAIIVLITVITTLNLNSGKNNLDLIDATKQVAILLRQAQSNATAQKNGTSWGVHFENSSTTAPSFYALFDASNYSTSSIIDRYNLPSRVAYLPATIAYGATLDVIFAQITGAPNATASIGLYVPAQTVLSSTIITVNQTGAISY